jgi:DNA adenine methylase
MMFNQVAEFDATTKINGKQTDFKAINVASVPQLSPFRYPGGKTWLFPWIKRWLLSVSQRPRTLVDAFAGGGSVSLAAVFRNLVDQAILIELDENVASVWETILNRVTNILAEKITSFDFSVGAVEELLSSVPHDIEEQAFRTILMNRTRYGGIIAPGAALVRKGENGHGASSRWYPHTLGRRITAIHEKRNNLFFIQGDGMQFLEMALRYRNVVYFIDPPYTVAGKRLYYHTDIDHEKLFWLANRLNGDVLITYDNAIEIHHLINKYKFQVREVPMLSTKHQLKRELLIGRQLDWVDATT